MTSYQLAQQISLAGHEAIFPQISVHFTNPFRFGNSHSDLLFLHGYVRIANRSGITKTEWISSETERYLWKYYFVASLIVDMSFILLFARISSKYGLF